MQILDGRLLLSATDLVNFLGCRHATYLDLRDLADPVEIPARDAATGLIFEKGIEHEKRYLASVKARGLNVIEAIEAIGRLDCSHLLIQGPPGAGKTYTASHAIVEMLARGKRVGVSSHSHKAINNLLQAVETAATDRGLRFHGIKKSSYEEQYLNGSMIEDTTDNGEAAAGGHDLIAGTAWLFAREELDRRLDYLFIDEAGQVSLANTVAMGVSAENVILVGDQMQLSQPLKGSHPGRSGLSALEHLLDGAATVPTERGVFLSKTRRMHPDLCRFT